MSRLYFVSYYKFIWIVSVWKNDRNIALSFSQYSSLEITIWSVFLLSYYVFYSYWFPKKVLKRFPLFITIMLKY